MDKFHDWDPTRAGKPLLQIESPKSVPYYSDEMKLIPPGHRVQVVLIDFEQV